MNREHRDSWVVGLRSKKYPQGRGFLNRNGRFCCLGVLCEVLINSGVDEIDKSRTGAPEETFAYDGEDTGLSIFIRTKTGLGWDDEDVLITMNDNDGKSFEEIADYIEENL